MVLCDLYLKRFDLTKGLLFDTFIGRQNKKLQIKCIPVYVKKWAAGQYEMKCAAGKTYLTKCAAGQILTKS